MLETAQTIGDIRFPKAGSNWTPLPRGKQSNRVQAHAVQTIRATPKEVYNTYARAELLPAWQEGVVSVQRTGENKLHWKIQDPGTGTPMEFDSEELEKVPGQRHVSRITTGPLAGTTATLTLEPHHAGRGTITTLISDFTVPGGWFTNAVASVVSRSPQQTVIENLRHMKELIESGQIPTVEGQPAGRRGISDKLRQILMGENLPTPPGTRVAARPQDEPETAKSSGTLGSRAVYISALVVVPLVMIAGILINMRDE